jgi:hypothetical protein
MCGKRPVRRKVAVIVLAFDEEIDVIDRLLGNEKLSPKTDALKKGLPVLCLRK